MIKITIEIWKQGNPLDKSLLGVIDIINDGTGTKTKGNYSYSLISKGRKFRKGRIVHFERKKKNVFFLLYEILKNAIWEQQGETPL
jgi:hypothetical protein